VIVTVVRYTATVITAHSLELETTALVEMTFKVTQGHQRTATTLSFIVYEFMLVFSSDYMHRLLCSVYRFIDIQTNVG